MPKHFILLFLLFFALEGCIVSKKKFDDLLAQKVKADGELAEQTEKLNKTNSELTELNTLYSKRDFDFSS
jgi:chemotaxis protein MotB